ncbi:UDP-N-acetylmuramoyl-tripeptide--D-alanyl-D-alanine ligase [Bacillus kwashiorkori]|uniref:UDP-N-acetylmuramoyl-tripeptide--D-alanyl-D- alanine ligase n=1 Tax=Bacillus kwashiorkori TaxID=1522318 RepID=UPI00078548E8|nr:UDP-N-acetylmuramoyl-tripeptide--D-alanyl-D-alanine ligase [Bacillus kwashiorkori]
MIQKTIKELAAMLDVKNDVSAFADVTIHGASINTLTITKENLFIPLKGEKRDGHEFVGDAFEKGATAVLWQADVPNPPTDYPVLIVDDTLKSLQELARKYREELEVKVVGVTGSNGKTTTKDILAELLSIQYKTQKTIGNFNNHIGLPLTILGLDKDTEVAVLEMGMDDFGQIDFLTNMAKPDAAIITNIGEAHLQELGSRKGIAKAKMEILNGLREDGLFVYPGEEPLISEQLSTRKHDWKTLTFGKDPTNDFYIKQFTMKENGSEFHINQSMESFFLPVLGEYNVLNALACICVAQEWGVKYEQMNAAFQKLRLTQMRMELMKGLNGSTILNDAYNASPTSMKAVIQLVTDLQGYDKKILVLGDMLELGEQEAHFHQQVGKSIDKNEIDLLYTYGKLAAHIAEGAKQNKLSPNKIHTFTNKQGLIEHLKNQLEDGTIVLVKASRGMRLEEVVLSIINHRV